MISIYCLWNDCNQPTSFLELLLLIGTVLAIVICWTRTNSIRLSIFAGIFGWFYIIYYIIAIRPNDKDDD